jgi:Tfp pilus assembly protein PilF
MVSFMLVKTDLEDSRFDNALKKLAIYEGVDPKNPDVYLMYARYYMQMGDSEKMKENFTKAQQLGFNDYETYKNEQFWKALFENEGIIALQ